MKLPPIFNKNKEHTPWQWPSCKQPKTLSFRASGDDVFKTVNSMFFDPVFDGGETPESWFTNSSDSASFSTDSDNGTAEESLEMVVVRGARSERLFFEPVGDTSSILKGTDKMGVGRGSVRFKESVVLAMESDDPYVDFRKSMEEMVESLGLKDWEGLEQLLGWYLKVNGKENHGFIIGAFIDLIVDLNAKSSSSSSSSNSTCYSSAISSFGSSPLCSTQSQGDNNKIQEEKDIVLS